MTTTEQRHVCPPIHGHTDHCYQKHGCRCDHCVDRRRQLNRAAARRYRDRHTTRDEITLVSWYLTPDGWEATTITGALIKTTARYYTVAVDGNRHRLARSEWQEAIP